MDLRRPSNWQAQSPPRRHKPRDSIARGLETLIGASLTHHLDHPPSSYPGRLSPFTAAGPSANVHSSINGSATTPIRLSPNRRNTDSTWEVVDDLPLRWATDFVPLGSTGSRLANALILFYALWGEERKGKGGRLLAVATKSNILLYETPKGERAFRFVKVSNYICCINDFAVDVSDCEYRSSTLHYSLEVSLSFNNLCRTYMSLHIRERIAPALCGEQAIVLAGFPRLA